MTSTCKGSVLRSGARGYVERIVSYDEIAKAETMPPLDTRNLFSCNVFKEVSERGLRKLELGSV